MQSTANTTSSSMLHAVPVSSLTRGLDSLPQELWNQIYDDVFTASPSIRDLDDKETCIRALHVSHSSREIFAQSYYGHAAGFKFRQHVEAKESDHTKNHDSKKITLPPLFRGWVSAIPVDHVLLMQQIVAVTPDEGCPHGGTDAMSTAPRPCLRCRVQAGKNWYEVFRVLGAATGRPRAWRYNQWRFGVVMGGEVVTVWRNRADGGR